MKSLAFDYRHGDTDGREGSVGFQGRSELIDVAVFSLSIK